MWQIVVTEIPYQVQKGKLIERLAEIITTKKVPLLPMYGMRVPRTCASFWNRARGR